MRLCANKVGFKNGGTTNLTQLNLTQTAGPFNYTDADENVTNAILGSNWCRGTNGLGVEFRGTYSFDYFDDHAIRLLDYCSPTGTPRPGLAQDDEAQMDWCPYDFDENCDDCSNSSLTSATDDDDAAASLPTVDDPADNADNGGAADGTTDDDPADVVATDDPADANTGGDADGTDDPADANTGGDADGTATATDDPADANTGGSP